MRMVYGIKRVIALLLGVFLLCTMPGITVLAESASSTLDLSSVTTFTFDGTSVTVTEGDSDNYEVVIYDDTDSETDPDVTEDEDGNTVYSVPEGSTGELRVSIKKKGRRVCLLRKRIWQHCGEERGHEGCSPVSGRAYAGVCVYCGD